LFVDQEDGVGGLVSVREYSPTGSDILVTASMNKSLK